MAKTSDDVLVTHRPDGSMLFQRREPIAPYPARLTERLEHFATTTPATIFLAQRGAAPGWETLSYGELWRDVQSLGEALLQSGAGPERPVAVLSGNDLDHARLMLACAHVGIPYAPIAPAYSLVASDFTKLRLVAAQLTPGLVYTNNGTAFANALDAVFPDLPIWVSRNPPPGRDSALLADLLTTEPSPAVAKAAAAVTPDTVAKILFTSGSTGQPKGVINTHRMLTANQQMLRQVFAFVEAEPPVLLDWLPWNHTFGGNYCFGLALYNGGSFYIDDGRPTPSGIRRTARNLAEVSPTVYLNVPRGFDALAGCLEADPRLAASFFARLQVIFYAGASLSEPVWDRLNALALRTCGERVMMLTSLGSTETAPMALAGIEESARPGAIGVPVPGVTVKLVPTGTKLELRVSGPTITPGYLSRPDLTAAAFDDEGFYRLGDAVRFLDPAAPARGFVFDGRIAEDFKLSTGVWVNVAQMRGRLLALFAGLVRDVVMVGHDRDELGALLVPAHEALAALVDGPCLDPLTHPAVRQVLHERLQCLEARGSSERVVRVAVLREPLSLDAGEITDKGSINASRVLERRAALVAGLYAKDPGPEVIVLQTAAAVEHASARNG